MSSSIFVTISAACLADTASALSDSSRSFVIASNTEPHASESNSLTLSAQ